MVKCLITGKTQRQLAHGYVCWASNGFSHCISCGGNAVLSKVTYLHLLFLRQPKGAQRGCWKSVSDAKTDFLLCFLVQVFCFPFEILSMNVVGTISEYKSALTESFHSWQDRNNASWVSNQG